MNKTVQAEYDVNVLERDDGATIRFMAARRSKLRFGAWIFAALIAILMIIGVAGLLLGLFFLMFGEWASVAFVIAALALLAFTVFLSRWQHRIIYRKHEREIDVSRSAIAADGKSFVLSDIGEVYLGSAQFSEGYTTSMAVANVVNRSREELAKNKGGRIEMKYGSRRLTLVEGLGPDMAPDLLQALEAQMRRMGWIPS